MQVNQIFKFDESPFLSGNGESFQLEIALVLDVQSQLFYRQGLILIRTQFFSDDLVLSSLIS
jgi:hypothetical protein